MYTLNLKQHQTVSECDLLAHNIVIENEGVGNKAENFWNIFVVKIIFR